MFLGPVHGLAAFAGLPGLAVGGCVLHAWRQIREDRIRVTTHPVRRLLLPELHRYMDSRAQR
ncbi:hypothetical protein [Streptomyces abikoensis]